MASTVYVDGGSPRFALPYGFIQSPLLASIALDKSELGNCLRRLHSRSVLVSVYVDDIIVSANSDNSVAQAISEIRSAARKSGFPINEAKSSGPSNSLHAFNIDFSAHNMRIADERFETMRGKVLMNGAGPVSQAVLGYVLSINKLQAEEMLKAFPRSFPGPHP